MKKILVATDGSDNAKKALIEAKKMGEILGADIDIIKVIDEIIINPYTTQQYHTMQTDEELKRLGEELLVESLKFFDDYKGKVDTKLRRGDPGNAIIKEVEKEGYDLIVMGSRGLGTFSRVLLGSVSNKVVNHVKTNVLIVR